MKTKISRAIIATLLIATTTSCTTAYDAYGRPQQVVDPGAALVGAAAVGLLAYGLANSDNHRDYYRDDCRPHHSYYRQPSCGHSSYYRPRCGY